jgi:hypothetical protein
VIRLRKANCTVSAHNQVRVRKSAQPSATSARSVERAGGSGPGVPALPRPALGSWSRLRASTLTAYVAASTATTTAEPARATSTPPSAGPAILVAEPARPYSEFALASWSRGAISTVRALRAGVKNAVPMPPSQASRTNSHSGGRPTASATASVAWAAQRSTSAPIITRRRPSRSAIAPANGSNKTWGTTVAVNTRPSPVAPTRLSSTAQAIATVDIDEPSREVTKPT